MAYDDYQLERITRILDEKNISFYTKKMMGGVVVMIDDKMACGIHLDKKLNSNILMARIGAEAVEEALKNPHCMPMAFTGRVMKDYLFVKPNGYDNDSDLEYWVDLCLIFNPLAKKSKKRKKKI